MKPILKFAHDMLKYIVFFAPIILFANTYLYGQTTIAGPTCVTHNVEYQYNVTGNWDSASRVEVCITGGIIMGENKSCFSGRPLSFFRVRWNENIRSGKIEVKSLAGTVALNVSITPLLKEGKLDSTSSFQIIDYNTIPGTIVCTKASGGNCSPTYNYQWQQSANGVSWTDVENTVTTDLKITTPLTASTYYRRLVIETVSKSRGYSAVATVIVKEPARSN